MAANLLRHAGYDVRFLGPDVPVQSLAQIVGRRRPHVVALTVTMRDSAMLVDLALAEIDQRIPGHGSGAGRVRPAGDASGERAGGASLSR